MITTELSVAGIVYNDFRRMKVQRSTGEYNQSSNFSVTLDSPFGRHKNDFSVGNEIIIRAEQDFTVTSTGLLWYSIPLSMILIGGEGTVMTKIFIGILEKIEFKGQGTRQTVILSGRDYSARLQDVTVEPAVYTNSEISTIVTNIIDNEVDDVTTTNVDVTTTTLERIAFNHKSVFDALQQLAELSGFIFWIDTDKDLHFERQESVSSNVTLNNTNILAMDFDTTREKMANQIFVYGDRQLSSVKEILVSGTAPSTTGSDYTLTYRPHNTSVESSDFVGSILQGGILNMITTPTSGPDYLVSFEDSQLVFVSGTSIGYDTIPTGSIIVNYERDIPIVKFGINRASITAFGPKELIITDKSIKDPQTAKDILLKRLEESNPLNRFEASLKGWFTFNPGETVLVNLSDYDINNKTVRIIDITYIFTKERVQDEAIIKVRLDKKVIDITDEIKGLKQGLEALQTEQQTSADLLTRFELSTGSFIPVGSMWYVQTRTDLGSSFIIGKGFHGVTGATFGGILGSIITSGINFLGDSRNSLGIVTSGGFDYTTL